MKRHFLFSLLAILVPFLINGMANSADLFPMKIGQKLIYTRTDSADPPNIWNTELRVIEKVRMCSNDYFHIQSWNYDDEGEIEDVYARSDENNIYRCDTDSGVECSSLGIGPVGATWTCGDDEIEIMPSVVVSVPYGDYTAVVNKKYNTAENSPPWIEYFVPGLGIVQELDHWNDNPPMVMELIRICYDGAADFISDTVSGTAPLTLNFTDKSCGILTSWSWDFGDGSTSSEQNPSHTYTYPGTYNVSLTVEGSGGLDTKTIAVKVNDSSDVEEFVTQFYQLCLNRNPDQDGLVSWVSALLDGTLTGSDVAYGFIFSPEFINKNPTNEEYLQVLYEAFFNRQPDSAGWQGWLDAMLNGANREVVLKGFIYATEFNELCRKYGIIPNSVAGFVTRFYNLCLRRDPDIAGLDGWVASLLSGENVGADVAIGFISSPEFTKTAITDEEYMTILYKAFFDRDPDTAGLQGWLDSIAAGKTREEVLDGFINSAEFGQLCQDYGITPFK